MVFNFPSNMPNSCNDESRSKSKFRGKNIHAHTTGCCQTWIRKKIVVGVVIILIAIYLWGMEKKHISFIDHVVKMLDSCERLSEGIEHSTGWYWQNWITPVWTVVTKWSQNHW